MIARTGPVFDSTQRASELLAQAGELVAEASRLSTGSSKDDFTNHMEAYSPTVLTPSQLDVLQLYSRGETPEEIRQIRHCELSTVYNHLKAVRGKLDTKSSPAAAARAKALGIL